MEKYKTLYELFNEELSHFPNNKARVYESIDDFITNDKKAAEFINTINYGDSDLFKEDNINNSIISQGRARHAVISLFLGMVLGKLKGLFKNYISILNVDSVDYIKFADTYIVYKLWMLTAINHDYGYHINYIHKKIDIDDLPISYNLFDDNIHYDYEPLINYKEKYPEVLKNTYDQIKEYYNYAHRFHKHRGDEEKNDHGILGALLLYDRISKKNNKELRKSKLSYHYMNNNFDYKDMLFYKTACLTIAQHNIFKSDNEERDKCYGEALSHLYHDANYYVDEKHKLLYLLSLVDTVECIKTFSKSESSSEYFHTLTVLKNVELLVTEDEIVIDFGKLYDKIKKDKEELLPVLESHIDGIMKLNTWTSFKVTRKDNTKVIIR